MQRPLSSRKSDTKMIYHAPFSVMSLNCDDVKWSWIDLRVPLNWVTNGVVIGHLSNYLVFFSSDVSIPEVDCIVQELLLRRIPQSKFYALGIFESRTKSQKSKTTLINWYKATTWWMILQNATFYKNTSTGFEWLN